MGNLSESFLEAGVLMLVGMGFVFAFLGLLIVAIKLLALFASQFPETSPAITKVNTAKTNNNDVPAGVVAAISSAITQYRKNNKEN